MNRLTVITNGSPESAALAAWLSRHLPVKLVEARGDEDARRVADARMKEKEKRLVLASGSDQRLTSDALRVVTDWVADLSPFDVRARGPERVEAQRARHATGSETLDELLAKLTPVRITRTPGRRGRPKGSDPFRGVGFDVCIALLLEPERRWTDRAVADFTGRAPSAVHKTLAELAARDLVARGRTGTLVRDPVVLRTDLLAHWRRRATHREGKGFRSRNLETFWTTLRQATAPHLLAATSATTGAWAFEGGPVIAYTTAEGLASLERKFDPVSASLATLILWQAPEAGVFLAPRDATPQRTNRVVTWLDLVTLGGAREQEAAAAVWNGDA